MAWLGKAFLTLKHLGYSRKDEEQEGFRGRGNRKRKGPRARRAWNVRTLQRKPVCLEAKELEQGWKELRQQPVDAEC